MPNRPRPVSIPTNQRLLLILEALAKRGVPATPSDINADLGLPKATIYRLFATLEQTGMIQRELDGQSFSPGSRLRIFASNILSSLRVRTARISVLKQLAEEIGETCNLAIPDLENMIYLDRIETKWPLRIQLPIGTKVPFYCTASGKMYLSSLNSKHLHRYLNNTRLIPRANNTITDPDILLQALSRIRKQGYAEDNQEFIDGMIALAAPVYDNQQRLLSTVSFHAPTQRLSLEQAKQHLPRLTHTSRELAQLILAD